MADTEKLEESRALPGGMLNSKEKTEYENWLEKLHKELDNVSESKDTCTMPLLGKDAGANGCHNYDGTLMTDKNRVHGVFTEQLFESIYNECARIREGGGNSDTAFIVFDRGMNSHLMTCTDSNQETGNYLGKTGRKPSSITHASNAITFTATRKQLADKGFVDNALKELKAEGRIDDSILSGLKRKVLKIVLGDDLPNYGIKN